MLGFMLGLGLAFPPPPPAQDSAPALHHRDAATAAPLVTKPADAHSNLPPDADGEYQFGETGEVIEIYVENGVLHGYLLKRAERAHSGSTPLTYDFASGSASQGSVTFTTKVVHGESYSFTGSVVRGPSNSPATLGYYLLRGQLTLRSGDTPDTRSVVLERLGQH